MRQTDFALYLVHLPEKIVGAIPISGDAVALLQPLLVPVALHFLDKPSRLAGWQRALIRPRMKEPIHVETGVTVLMRGWHRIMLTGTHRVRLG